jgi:glycosyltransferase involved in cell wall biosynthesis
LKTCINSFITQNQVFENVEYIVVDNQSTDDTKEITLNFQHKLNNLVYVFEEKIGLSHARNKGVETSKYDWVCFMDDDALAHADFNEVMMETIKNNLFDGFGGMFYPWYRTPKPKWLSPIFGQMPMLRNDIGPLPNNQHVAGGICAFKKQHLLKAGGFPPDIGMRGNIVGYGEENYLQDKMRANGDVIGFVPNWKMDHLVAEYKYTLNWQLKRFIGKGRDKQLASGKKLSFIKKILLGFRAIAVLFFYCFKLLPKVLFNKNYYFQNYLLDVLNYPCITLGKITV